MKSSAEQTYQSSFLHLPRELRDRIYDEVLDLSDPVPDMEASVQGRRALASTRRISITPKLPSSASSSLRRCNRQISEEVFQMIRRRGASYSHGLTSKLDLLLQGSEPGDRGNVKLFATWIALPAPMLYTNKVHVNVRVSNPEGLFWIGCGGPGYTTTDLMHLLGCFFAYGPSFEKATRSCTPILIRELCLDVVENDEKERYSVYRELSYFLGCVARNGVLGGKLHKIFILIAGTLRREFEVIKDTDPSTIAATVKEWERYGWIAP
ncbi:MAG: hypothetical protein Q9174_001917 [Haloplaca sp. 1 TL-2023]